MDLVPVYIAASWGNRFRLREIRDRLKTLGLIVTSEWIDIDREYTDGDFGTEADRDYANIDDSEFLIVDTTDERTKGGREWEAGYATGTGKQVVRIGPIIIPFHGRVSADHPDWDTFLARVQQFREYEAANGSQSTEEHPIGDGATGLLSSGASSGGDSQPGGERPAQPGAAVALGEGEVN